MSIFELLARARQLAASRPTAGAGSDTDTVRRIVAALDKLDRDRARYIAAFAYLLARVALADRVVSDAEARTMETIVHEQGNLPEEQAVLVMQLAKSQNLLFGGTEDFLVTREFDQMATLPQKLALLDCLFAVSAADAGIATIEDNEIRRIAVELKVPHDEYIRIRLAYRQHLNVLHEPPAEQ
ncbi:MAG: TerB family tellurite resistance protein [Bacteroidales bacterium]